ncbi:MAG: hypothetical protein LBQ60_10510 [Bacteroidales bacterium]|jgi:hypothetical protein|nr:hypothetical protein [Bacteroidales bacterium]
MIHKRKFRFSTGKYLLLSALVFSFTFHVSAINDKDPGKECKEEGVIPDYRIRQGSSLPKEVAVSTGSLNKIPEKKVPGIISYNNDLYTNDLKSNGFFINNRFREKSDRNQLILLDGKEISQQQFAEIKPEVIKSFSISKEERLVEEYGEKAKNGVISVITKSE